MDERGAGPATIHRRSALAALAAMSVVAPRVAARTQDEAQRLSTNILTRLASDVRVDGRRGLFVIDTGAERTAISAELARSLNLSPGPDLLVHGVTEARVVPSVIIRRLTFAGREFDQVTAPVFDRDDLAADGLIGLDVLSRFRLELNLMDRRLRIARSGEPFVTFVPSTRLNLGGRARLGRFGHLILLNVTADGEAVEAFVDSGAQYSIGNSALLSALPRPTEVGLIDVFGVTGQTLRARRGRVDDLNIAGQALGATPLLFADLHAFDALDLRDRPAILLGADILYRFQRVTLDYGRGRVAFGRVRPAFAPPPTRRQAGPGP